MFTLGREDALQAQVSSCMKQRPSREILTKSCKFLQKLDMCLKSLSHTAIFRRLLFHYAIFIKVVVSLYNLH
ncbi:hypothetical protein Hdeb2414_s0008g00296691 [Helianthus debilis subsp. tardiflorus]